MEYIIYVHYLSTTLKSYKVSKDTYDGIFESIYNYDIVPGKCVSFYTMINEFVLINMDNVESLELFKREE